MKKAAGLKEHLRHRDMPLSSETQTHPRSQGSLLDLRRILVPVDFSSTSLRTLRSVIPLAHRFEAALVLVHVVERVESLNVSQDPNLTRAAKEHLGMVLESEVGGVVPGEAHVRIGRPFLEIVSFARLHDIDLIVIGPHGESHLGQSFLGSTAEKVMRHSPCPVLTLHEREPGLA
jgi:nucleotide-binding universal stress UspA family protein